MARRMKFWYPFRGALPGLLAALAVGAFLLGMLRTSPHSGVHVGYHGREAVLGNEAIEEVTLGDRPFKHIELGSSYAFKKSTVPILKLDDAALLKLSKDMTLSLNLKELHAIRDYFKKVGRDPSDIELESIAQTWSEHCKHKTFTGHITFEGKVIPNLLKSTIAKATQDLNKSWCVSVFKDNAGIIEFDETSNVCFKVETHNHPSAIEPYGGANTGLGGVIRDILGCG